MGINIWKIRLVQPAFCYASDTLAELKEQFVNTARESLRAIAHSLIAQEVKDLAGEPYTRGNGYRGFRAGSDQTTVRIGGQLVQIRKQRVKDKETKKEIPLKSYSVLRDGEMLTDRVLQVMIRGVSTRNYNELLEEVAGGFGLSKSSVSRAFIDGSRKALEYLQTRSLKGKIWCAIEVDAIQFAGTSIVVALGIEGNGKKFILGLREGNTESSEVCIDLFNDLMERGLNYDLPFIFVLDGGKGLRKAVKEVFEQAPVQRCLHHKQRNILEYLPKRVHGEFTRRWAKMRRSERYSDAQVEYHSIRNWLMSHSGEAVNSLDEAGEELLTVYKYTSTPDLLMTLRSTNLIESMFATVRTTTNRVKNWNPPSQANPSKRKRKSKIKDQKKRWCAIGVLAYEDRAKYVKGRHAIPALLVTLREKHLQTTLKVA